MLKDQNCIETFNSMLWQIVASIILYKKKKCCFDKRSIYSYFVKK